MNNTATEYIQFDPKVTPLAKFHYLLFAFY